MQKKRSIDILFYLFILIFLEVFYQVFSLLVLVVLMFICKSRNSVSSEGFIATFLLCYLA